MSYSFISFLLLTGRFAFPFSLVLALIQWHVKRNKAGQWQSFKPRGVHSPWTYISGNDGVRLWSLLSHIVTSIWDFFKCFFLSFFVLKSWSITNSLYYEYFQKSCAPSQVLASEALNYVHLGKPSLLPWHQSPQSLYKTQVVVSGLVVTEAPQDVPAVLIYRDLSFPQKLGACICCCHLSKHETYLKQKEGLSSWSKAFDYLISCAFIKTHTVNKIQI